MPAWITSIQGIREILNSAGTALARRKLIQFSSGFDAADDGSKTVVTLGNPSGAYASSLATLLRGVGLTVSGGTLKPRVRPRRPQDQDYFISGNTTSGQIGKLGWNLFGSGGQTVARVGTAINSSSRFELITSNTTNSRAVLKLGDTESKGTCVATDYNFIQTMWNLNNALTNVRAFFGYMGDFSQEPSAATDCLGIYYDSAVSPNYQIIARSGGAGSPVVTASAVPANNNRMATIHQSAAGVFDFRVAGALVGTISSGVPTATMDLGWRVETLTNASRKIRLGYFGYAGDISDVNTFAADAFLEV